MFVGYERSNREPYIFYATLIAPRLKIKTVSITAANNFKRTYVGSARTKCFGVYTVHLAGKSSNIRSYTVYINGSGQPLTYAMDTEISSGKKRWSLEI